MKRTLGFRPKAEQVKKAGLDLSLAQVLGGAFAAMTAAALGSRFGVEGTVVGAALASVIAALGSALYTASLRRTGETVRVVLGRRPRGAAGLEGQLNSAQPVSGATAAVALDSQPRLVGAADTSPRSSRRRALVVRSVIGAVATFALAAGALTMYEALSGNALSGGSGTTFSQVQENEREDRPTDEQAPAPSESADPSPTAEPSVTPEAESSSSAQPSAEPSVTPEAEPSTTAQPSVTPEAEPSTTAAPPSAAPSQADPAPR